MTRAEALVKWLVDESSKRYDSKYWGFANTEVLRALGVRVGDYGVWTQTYADEAMAYFNENYPHD